MININKIVIIGSGMMGSGIAEQFANADFKVYLLDIVPKNAINRNQLANQAIERIAKNLIKAKKLVIPGNLEDNLEIIKSADWIIEAIVEQKELKQQLYKKLDNLCKLETIISSNTSTIQLKQLIRGMSANFKQNFMITHFFNPPRYMQLVEIVTSKYTKQEAMHRIHNFLDIHLGKTPIESNDTPGFIANRIGCYWLQTALNTAIEMKISIEEADSLMSAPIGIPKTGIFGLYDLIGIDVMKLIIQSLRKNLPSTDDLVKSSRNLSLINKMIKNELIGKKGKGGFYRIAKDERGNTIKEVFDLQKEKYRIINPVINHYKNIREVIDNSEYGKKVLCKTLSYALNLIGEVSNSLNDIDQTMKLGYNWGSGPFELVDKLGTDYFKELLLQQNIIIPPILSELKSKKFYQANQSFDKAIFRNDSVIIKDLADDIAGIEIVSKMGILNHAVFDGILEFFAKYAHNFIGVVISSSNKNFSVGGDLQFMLEKATSGEYSKIKEYLELGQEVMLRIKYSSIPVAIALKGMALGGGCEILLHSHGIAAHVEASIGLVEANVGLNPGWGGCKEMMLRSKSEKERIDSFKGICLGKVFHSFDAFQNKFKNTKKVMNLNRVLLEAKQLAIELVKTHQIPTNEQAKALEINYLKVIKELNFYDYSEEVATKIAEIFSSKETSEIKLLQKEQEIFLALLHNQLTQEKIKQIL